MKRLIGLILLAVLLCGCTAGPQNETTAPTQTTVLTEPTEPMGMYVSGSQLEQSTGGAVRSYLLTIPDSYGMMAVGEDVLVFSGVDATTLTRLSGGTLYPIAAAQLGCMIDPEDASFQVGENGITYYDPNTREVIFLDNDLKEVNRLTVPENMVGRPALSSNRLKLYYCTAEAVRLYDLETGLDKLLKTISYSEQSVEGILMNDTVLRCSLVDSDGSAYSVFLSTQNGELLGQLQSGMDLRTGSGMYYGMAPEGTMNVLYFGKSGEETRMLTPADPFAESWVIPARNGAVTVSAGETEKTVQFYDLNTGLCTASVGIPLETEVWNVTADQTGSFVYLMGSESDDQTVIYRWDPTATPSGDDKVYTTSRYTLENPDVDGLTTCAGYASIIGEQYGVDILVGFDAVENQPWDYELEAEYQTPVIQAQLQKLEQLLTVFPDDFFEAIPGKERICLVRSITGSVESGSLDSAAGIQYWDGEIPYVILAAGESLEYSFFHEVFHIIDSKVLSDCRAYYYWHNLNPAKFDYYEDYTSYLTEDNSQYLQDEDRAFIDAYSMSYAKEDRARIMEYACTAGNEHYFQSEIMQEKLETLCEGIREAFDLREYPNELLWEQYLEELLVPES